MNRVEDAAFEVRLLKMRLLKVQTLKSTNAKSENEMKSRYEAKLVAAALGS